jgi:hypothetical protein
LSCVHFVLLRKLSPRRKPFKVEALLLCFDLPHNPVRLRSFGFACARALHTLHLARPTLRNVAADNFFTIALVGRSR